MVEIRDFDATEIREINNYISANAPYSILQQIFPLTEKPEEKAKIFATVYRIIYTARNMVNDKKTKDKLTELLEETKDVYVKLYKLLASYQSSKINFGKHATYNQIMYTFMDIENNVKINKLIDAFLVFVEKQVLYDINKISGINLGTEEGKRIYKELKADLTSNTNETKNLEMSDEYENEIDEENEIPELPEEEIKEEKKDKKEINEVKEENKILEELDS